jgi:hypothetical protein
MSSSEKKHQDRTNASILDNTTSSSEKKQHDQESDDDKLPSPIPEFDDDELPDLTPIPDGYDTSLNGVLMELYGPDIIVLLNGYDTSPHGLCDAHYQGHTQHSSTDGIYIDTGCTGNFTTTTATYFLNINPSSLHHQQTITSPNTQHKSTMLQP